MADDDQNEKPRLDYPIGLSLTKEEGAEVRAIADAADRPVAYIARVLVREALAARARAEAALGPAAPLRSAS